MGGVSHLQRHVYKKSFPLTNRNGATGGAGSLRPDVDRNNQVAFSRIKGSLPVRTDVASSGLDHCGKLGLEMIKARKGEVSAQSQAMPT